MNASIENVENPPKNKGGRPRRLNKPEKPKYPGRGRPRGATREWASFEEARAWAHQSGIKNTEEWENFKKKRDKKTNHRLKPKNIPSNLYMAYKEKGWNGFKDFFGTTDFSPYFPFDKARVEARRLGLKSIVKWDEWWDQYKPSTVPKRPKNHYKEWKGWNDFLGNNNRPLSKNEKFLSYYEALKLVHPLKLRGVIEYKEWHKANRPQNLPFRPDIVYQHSGWDSWAQWVGRTIAARMESNNTNTAVWYVVQYPNMPDNVFKIAIDPVGKKMVLDRKMKEGFQLLKLYKFEAEANDEVNNIIKVYSSPYWEGDNLRMSNSLHQLMFALDQRLQWA